MASPIDIVLKIGADIRDAITGMRRLGDEAEATGRKVESVSTRMSRIRTAAGAMLGRVAAGGLGALGVDIAGRQYDELFGTQAAIGRAAGNLQFAGGARELADAFWSQVNARAKSYSESGGIFGNLRSIGLDVGRRASFSSREGVSPSQEREAVELFRELARSDPARAQALLGTDLGRVEYLRGRFTSELGGANRGRAYTEQLAQGTTIINVNTGVGDRNAIGRELRAVIDARDRNNGRYVTTSTRRT